MDRKRKSRGRRKDDNIVQLVPRRISEETAMVLQDLWVKTLRGEITGIAFVAIAGGSTITGVVGTAIEKQDSTLGILIRQITGS